MSVQSGAISLILHPHLEIGCRGQRGGVKNLHQEPKWQYSPHQSFLWSASIAGHDHISCCPVATQHRPPVQQHDNDSSNSENEAVPGLGVGPGRTVHLEVVQCGNEEAALCGVEHGSQDHCDCQYAYKVRTEGPGALRASAEEECRQMPQAPDPAQDQAGPEWRIAALQKWQSQAAPAQLLNGPYDQPRGQGGQDAVPGREGEGIGYGALDGSAQIEGSGYAEHQ